jgi:hypothetical protein
LVTALHGLFAPGVADHGLIHGVESPFMSNPRADAID